MFKTPPRKELTDLGSLDPNMLQRSLDIAKTAAFLGKTGAFLGTILCATPWVWSKELSTAGTDGYSIVCDPHWWMELPKPTRATILLHELWHIAAMHPLRKQGRHHKTWNYACDIWINNRLVQDGYKFDGFSPWLRPGLSNDTTEEEIYDMLVLEGYPNKPKESPWGKQLPGESAGDDDDDEDDDMGDMLPLPPGITDIDVINKVVGGIVAQDMAGSKANLPPQIEKLVNNFLKPAVPWEKALARWLTDLSVSRHSWKRPNRRHTDIYLPSRVEDEGKLCHIRAYIDVSGSVDAAMATRFFSEMKYVKDFFQPDKLALVQFDDVIQRVDELGPDQTVTEITLVGRGGTDLGCVHADILEHRPSAVVILTDGQCAPMAEVPWDLPLIWIIMRNPGCTPSQGETFHLFK